MALSKVGEILLEAYKLALQTKTVTHFSVTDTASLIIRLEGGDGRRAVQEARRERQSGRNLTQDQRDKAAAKSVRRLGFQKKSETAQAQTPAFQVKRIAKNPPLEAQSGKPLPTTSLPKQEEKRKDVAAVKKPAFPKPEPPADDPENETGQEETALSLNLDEQDLLREMKPAAIGREFGVERLRATMDLFGMGYAEAQSATVLGAALLKHLAVKA